MPRPFDLGVVEPLRKHTATGYSFPSGHTQTATSFWSVWMIHLNKKYFYYVGSALVLLIRLSRIYLGVHWPMDHTRGTIFISKNPKLLDVA